MTTYRKSTYPPGTDKSKRRKHKSALELSAILVRECWNLFENVWAMRNNILHREDSARAKITNKHLTEELLDFKYNATEYLRHGDRGQIDYPDAEIIRWTIKRKGDMLNLLRRWRRQYQLETTLEAKKQRALTKFGFTAERPNDDNIPSGPTRVRRRRRARPRRRWRSTTLNRSLFGAVT